MSKPVKTVKDNGTIEYRNAEGQLHREDGPAVECDDGYKAWYQNGQRHSEDGPAVERANESKAWYINDEELSEEEFNERMSDSTDNSSMNR